ncbi:MAG: hypothetical protein HOP28_01355 [Gemmatimonadales bacterium]|nr:hypothetical protein [Gemmatimonadales bacterium]
MTWGLVALIGVPLSFAGLLVLMGYWDRRRIEDHVNSLGWTLLSVSSPPVGPRWMADWFIDSGERLYWIEVQDDKGAQRGMRCQTSYLGGTYVSEDATDPLRIVMPK